MRTTETATLFRGNVKYLCKKRGIKIGKLENALGVSQGYFSRPNNTMPIDVAYRAAKELCASLDDMCKEDLDKKNRAREIREKIRKLEIELAAINVMQCPPKQE